MKKVGIKFFYVDFFAYIYIIIKDKYMNYLVDPQTVVFNAHGIEGFTEMIRDEEIPQWDLLEIATEVVEEWSVDWPEDQGFGSSDGTYLIKDFIDTTILSFAKGYNAEFKPYLKIIKL